MQEAEWMLSAASMGEKCDDDCTLNMCVKLVTALDDSGMRQGGKEWCGVSPQCLMFFV